MEQLVFGIPLIKANLCGKVTIHVIGCRDREKKNEEKNARCPKSAPVIHKKPLYVFKSYFNLNLIIPMMCICTIYPNSPCVQSLYPWGGSTGTFQVKV